MAEKGVIRLDVGAVLDSKLGSRSRFVPRFLVRKLERLICQDGLNELLEKAYPRRGAAFCDKMLEELHVDAQFIGEELLPVDGRAVFVSNHPLGGLDGIALISLLSKKYGQELKFVVNDILMAIEPLRDVFLPINKHGMQSRESARELDDAFSGNAPVVIFPAGLCSRRGKDGKVADLSWKKMFLTKAIESGRPIVPLFFDGLNSESFYRWSNRRKKIGIKFNAEMALLPGEVFKAVGKSFRIYCGEPIAEDQLRSMSVSKGVDYVREKVYSLKKINQ